MSIGYLISVITVERDRCSASDRHMFREHIQKEINTAPALRELFASHCHYLKTCPGFCHANCNC